MSSLPIVTGLMQYPTDTISSRKAVFLPQIESLRGVAACVVAIYHVLITLNHPDQSWVWRSIKHVFNGTGAVFVFFVLSGFVLGLSLDSTWKNKPISNYFQFVARRLFRLYPPYLASLVLILIYVIWWHHPAIYSAASSWFNLWYQTLPPWSKAWDILTFKDIALNNIAWTLRSELICSCLLPFFHFLNRRISLGNNCFVLLLLIALPHYVSSDFVGNIYLFYLGLMVPAVNRCHLFAKATHPVLFYVALGSCLAVITQTGRPEWMEHAVLKVLPGFAAFGLVCLVASERQSQIHNSLHSELAKFYGRISYSFYLFHFFVLYLVATVLLISCSAETIAQHRLLFTGYLAVATFLFTTPLAWLSYKYIELPSTRLAKRLFVKKLSIGNSA